MVAKKISEERRWLDDIELFKVDKDYDGLSDKLKIKT